jgi:putative adhesin
MHGPATAARISRWGLVVMASALLIVGGAGALAIGSVTSSHERLVSFAVRGSLSGVALDVDDADVEIAGGGQRAVLGVQRTDRYAFGHDAEVQRTVTGGELRLQSRCPNAVPRACSVRYRVVVPDNVPVTVRTTSGTVRFRAYRGSARVTTRGGDVDVAGFCGFSLQARAESGDIDASAACAPQELTLRSTTGSVRVTVPPGRYQVEAESTSGSHSVSGLDAVSDAPFAIQALSSSGDVSVQAGRP